MSTEKLENDQEPLTYLHDFNLCTKNRYIYLTGEVNQESHLTFLKNLNHLNALSSDPIIIFMATEGGDIHYGLGIYDAIQNSAAKTAIIASSEVCSAGTFILQAPSLRLLTASAVFLIHTMSLSVEDRIKEIRSHVANSEKFYNLILNIYAKKMKKDVAYVSKWIDTEREIYLLPEEVIKMKLADGIFGSKKYPDINHIKNSLS